MSINAVSNSAFSLSSLSQMNGSSATSATVGLDNVPPAQAAHAHGHGGVRGALKSALSSLGLDSTSSASTSLDGSSSSSDVDAALNTFMQSLMAALHAQQSGTQADASNPTSASISVDSTQAASAAAAAGAVAPPGGGGQFESDLDNLIGELGGTSGSGGSTDSTSGSTTGTSGSASTVDASLESSFQNLLNTLGQGSSGASLSDVLNKLASNLGDGKSTGNFINTQA